MGAVDLLRSTAERGGALSCLSLVAISTSCRQGTLPPSVSTTLTIVLPFVLTWAAQQGEGGTKSSMNTRKGGAVLGLTATLQLNDLEGDQNLQSSADASAAVTSRGHAILKGRAARNLGVHAVSQ